MKTHEHLYTPRPNAGWGLGVWREMIMEAFESRELAWRLFIRDFSARYRQSALGVLWAVILPMIAVGTFVLLNSSGLLNVGETSVPYPVYALLGLTIWWLFAEGLVTASNSIVKGGSMVVKINFPKETLIFAATGEAVFGLLVRVVLLAVVLVIFQVAPKWTVVFFPFTLVPLLLLTVGLGFILSLLAVVVRDVANIVVLLTSFLMLLTPVVYPPPESGLLAVIMALNPLTGLVTAVRDMVFTGYLTDPFAFAWASVLAVAIFFFGWRAFHLGESRMAERV